MPFVLLILALAALAAGISLLWWDQRQRTAHSSADVASSAAQPVLETEPDTPDTQEPEPEYEPTPEPEAALSLIHI